MILCPSMDTCLSCFTNVTGREPGVDRSGIQRGSSHFHFPLLQSLAFPLQDKSPPPLASVYCFLSFSILMAVRQGTGWANWQWILLLILVILTPSRAKPDDIIGPELSRNIGRELFRAYPHLEASGLVWLPHEHLLAGVSDTGDVFMVNPDNEAEYYMAENVLGRGSELQDFEGVTFDPYLIETEDESHIYVACEQPPALLYITYQLPTDDADHSFASIELANLAPLDEALPSNFEDNKGIESLTMYQWSTATTKAVFFVGLQDNGKIYQVDSDGQRVSSADVISVGKDADIDQRHVSGSHYEPSTDTLFLMYDKQNAIAAIEVASQRVLATFRSRDTQEEGLAVRGDRIYICSDESGNTPSFIAEHRWFPELPTPPSPLGEFMRVSMDLIQTWLRLFVQNLLPR